MALSKSDNKKRASLQITFFLYPDSQRDREKERVEERKTERERKGE